MAESAIGFTFGVFGFLATVRNGIEKLLKDIDDWGSYHQELFLLGNEVQVLLEHVFEWQKFWYIDETNSAVDELVEEYWGEGKEDIVLLLSSIKRRAENINTEFEDLHGFSCEVVRGKWKEPTRIEGKAMLKGARERLEAGIHEVKKDSSRGKQTMAVLGRSSIFRSHLETMRKEVDKLQNRAEAEFVKCNGRGDTSQLRTRVTEFAADTLLPKVSFWLARQGEKMRVAIVDAKEEHVAVNLHLDHGLAADKRLETMVQSCLNDAMRTQFHKTSSRGAHECLVAHSTTYPLPEAMDLSEHGMQHFVAVQDIACNAIERYNLWHHLVTTGKTSLTSAENHQIRFELAEFAVLFLRSTWLRDVCGCCIHRFEDLPFRRGRFTVNVQCTDHFRRRFNDVSQHRPWCGQRSLGNPTWRLGLLLLELALGRFISRIIRHDGGERLATLFIVDEDGNETRYVFYEYGLPEDMRLEVASINQDLADTINTCLIFDFGEGEDDIAAFQRFYWEAVLP